MTKPDDRPYSIEGRQLIAETPDLRVQILTLAAGEEVPWHYHSEIADSFICLDGPMLVETRAPRVNHRLETGESCDVPAKTAHRVSGEEGGACRFVIVQGVGTYDYIPITQASDG
ncbi:cupin domain-containing protein [Pelagibius sp. Alg239-R121]|uniref:cupin domain-containing protein n=1 Tax=Pelagibius sp. Alg239-R121 TaxID=2993448 RepID=UPI0024A76664|nr:cupin domain-containing protein [Pelagibius sp. Alg239-R121]